MSTASTWRLVSPVVMAAVASLAHAQIPPDEVPVRLPEGYDPNQPAPLIIALHGYTGSGNNPSSSLFGLWPMASEMGFLYASPTGSQDPLGNNYWNATDACCDFFNANIDHIGYIQTMVNSIQGNYSVDPDRIHLIGHSNGGFMCHAMACAHPELFASITAVAGVGFAYETDCDAAETVHVLQVHGTDDDVIAYDGGWILGVYYPGAWETVDMWAVRNACGPLDSQVLGTIDMDNAVSGAETMIRSADACEAGGSAQLWSLEGTSHGPSMTNEGRQAILQYMQDHTKGEQPLCLADVNGDLRVDIDDLLMVLAAFGQSGPVAADITGDQQVDIDDLSVCISVFGAGC